MDKKKESEVLIIDIIRDCIVQNDISFLECHYENQLTFINKITYFLLNKFPLKILYVFSEFGFSGLHEMRQKINITNWIWLRRIIDEMVDVSILIELDENHPDYKLIISFWKNEYITTHAKIPKLYLFNNNFEPILTKYQSHITSKYFKKNELRDIQLRKESYARHKSIVINQIKKQSENSIGNCKICSSFIKESYKQGKDYQVFNGNMICNICYSEADKNTIIKWMQTIK